MPADDLENLIAATAGGIVLPVRVIPRAGRSGIAGTRDGALLIRLKAPPVEGAANEELIEVLGRLLDVPRRHITIVSGAHARSKRVQIGGMNAARAAGLLARHLAGG